MTALAASVIAAILGTLVALHYARLGLTLTHYDARGHLIVARRVIDSITPGWQQIGAVAAAPHVLNLLPGARSTRCTGGRVGHAISILRSRSRSGESRGSCTPHGVRGAAVAAAAFALNPNAVPQSTPMTEPVLA